MFWLKLYQVLRPYELLYPLACYNCCCIAQFIILTVKQGVMKAINVNKLTSAGCHVKIWIADWFAQLNNKLGGDLKKIRVVGEYMIEIWKAVGMKMEGVEFLWSSDEINSRAHEYWPLVMDIARKNKLPRIIR